MYDPTAGGTALVLQRGRRERLGDQLYGQILEQIVSGRVKEGDRLPTELEISTLFGVSRPIVREALLRLRADGLLRARPGIGTFVVKRPPEKVTTLGKTAALAGYLRAVEVRLPVEGTIARLAAERRTEEELARIDRDQRAFAHAIRERRARAAEDLAFHASVADAAHNDVFCKVLDEIRAGVAGFMGVSLALTSAGSEARAHSVEEEHERIVDAIRASDGDAAQLAMQYHITQARLRVLDRNRDT